MHLCPCPQAGAGARAGAGAGAEAGARRSVTGECSGSMGYKGYLRRILSCFVPDQG